MTEKEFHNYLKQFRLHKEGEPTKQQHLLINGKQFPVFINEFWTAQQRQANPIHEVSYRACFKPQLPRFFIELFTDNFSPEFYLLSSYCVIRILLHTLVVTNNLILL